MSNLDFIIGPFYLFIFTVIAIAIRPALTNQKTRKYYLPALWLRFLGSVLLGVLYKYYYGTGDTFGFYNQSAHVHDAFIDNPIIGFKLLFSESSVNEEIIKYSSRIYWFKAASELTIVKIAGLFSLISFRSYIGITLFFSIFSFLGSWLMYSALQQLFPKSTKALAVACLFIPSTIFWGSGLLKDTVTLGSLGLVVWAFLSVFALGKWKFEYLIVLLFGFFLLYKVKLYILICLIPALLAYLLVSRVRRVRSKIARILMAPLLLIIIGYSGYFLVSNISNSSEKYNLDTLAKTAFITSYDIGFYTGKNAGSGYSLGYQDGTWDRLIRLAPQAINVSLFRPYLWEIRNPLMLLSGIESFLVFLLTISTLSKFVRGSNKKIFINPVVLTFLIFSLAFSFAVGVSTYNFGSLSRYKIPLLPFYVSALFIIRNSVSTRFFHKP